MKNLKLLLTAIICLGLLFISAKLFAEDATVNRTAIRVEQSSAQRAEGAEEAWQSYEARLSEYNNLLPGDKAALDEYRAAALGKAISPSMPSSAASSISGPSVGNLPPAVSPGDGIPAIGGMPAGPRDGAPATPAGNQPVIKPVIQPPAPPATVAPKTVPVRGEGGYGARAREFIPADDADFAN
jgi:hypothetical protein